MIEAWRSLSVSATSDLVPLVVITHTPTYTTREVALPGGGTAQVREETGSKPVYGAGATPFGFKIRLGSSPKARLFAATSVGALWFTRNMPIPNAAKFNYSLEYGAGIELGALSKRVMILGYKFHHLSNANKAAVNPGLDSDVIYVGVSHAR